MDIQSASPVFNTEHFKQLYQRFDQDTLKQLPAIYASEIFFKDPIHQLTGIAALSDYFKGFCNPQTQCRFEFTNQIITDNQAFFQWTMHYQHPRLKQGASLSLNGASIIKFNSTIFYHEDFYDMGAMIYQHIPFLGWVVKKVNARITEQTQ